jgi:hypothetical protein
MRIPWFHRKRIRELWAEGFSATELAIMFDMTPWRIYYITRGIKRPDRI